MDITLRSARHDEAGMVAEIIRAAFEEYRGVLVPDSGAHAETAEKISAKMAKGGALLACEGERVLGCVVFYPDDGSMYLGRLAVLPAYRGYGIAGRLVEAVEARAREIGLPRVYLGVRVALPGNRAFFERRGYTFHHYDSHPGHESPTFMILEKHLAATPE
ncbi:MAG: GNAT family N-acetyltransferase [Anaerolineae bacterium]|nr:GNAT family N-acetyltransferase [Anaerolineae bacterium]